MLKRFALRCKSASSCSLLCVRVRRQRQQIEQVFFAVAGANMRVHKRMQHNTCSYVCIHVYMFTHNEREKNHAKFLARERKITLRCAPFLLRSERREIAVSISFKKYVKAKQHAARHSGCKAPLDSVYSQFRVLSLPSLRSSGAHLLLAHCN